jgi:hypothetical protein
LTDSIHDRNGLTWDTAWRNKRIRKNVRIPFPAAGEVPASMVITMTNTMRIVRAMRNSRALAAVTEPVAAGAGVAGAADDAAAPVALEPTGTGVGSLTVQEF